MRLKFLAVVFFFTTTISFFAACTKESAVTTEPENLDMTEFDQQSPLTNLGRVLFYDKHLSVNASISCASCHKQAIAFSDNVAHSRGYENILTPRNSLPIQNINLNSFMPLNLFWDGRESELTTMVLKPILNHVEMGMGSDNDIVERVRVYPYYTELFMSAFGSTDVTASKISVALSSFIGSISSENSRFDRAARGDIQLSGIEKFGQELFFTKYNCNSCHRVEEPGFYGDHPSPAAFVNIGLDQDYADNGRFDVTNQVFDKGKFKVPDLRNVGVTAPYMHDGRFSTLDEVIDHYSHGIADHPNLDFRLWDSQGNAAVMNISELEKSALIAFMNALTDYTMLTDKKLADPFKH